MNVFELMTDYEPDLRLEVLINVARHISKVLHLEINLCREVRDWEEIQGRADEVGMLKWKKK